MIDTPATRRAFASAISGGFVAVGRDAPSTDVLRVFWEVLHGYELTDIERAVMLHLATPEQGAFPPKPADLIRLIDGDARTNSAIAWSKVENAIRRIGSYRSVVFDDRLIHAVVSDMGGWTLLAMVSEEDLPFRGREFENRYKAYRTFPPQSHPKILTGLIQTDEVAHGREPSPPVLIGNENMARQVYLDGSTDGTLRLTQARSIRDMIEDSAEGMPKIERRGT